MSNRNTIFLLSALFIVIVSTSLLVRMNKKKADYQPPVFVSESVNNDNTIAKADSAFKKNDFRTALHLYQKASKAYPGNYPLLFKIANTYTKLDNYTEAEKILLSLCQKAPDNASFQSFLASTQLNSKKYDDALDSAQKAIALKPADGLAYLVKAAIHAQRKELDQCLQTFTKITPTVYLINFLKKSEFDPIRKEEKFISFQEKVLKLAPKTK